MVKSTSKSIRALLLQNDWNRHTSFHSLGPLSVVKNLYIRLSPAVKQLQVLSRESDGSERLNQRQTLLGAGSPLLRIDRVDIKAKDWSPDVLKMN